MKTALCVYTLLAALCYASPGYTDSTVQQRIDQYIAEKNYSAAENELKQLLDQDPSRHELRYQLARTLAWQGKYPQANQQFDILLDQHADNSDYLFAAAQSRHWSGDDQAALKLLGEARQLSVNDPDIWQLEISILVKSKTSAGQLQAEQLLQQAKKRFPAASWTEQFASRLSARGDEYDYQIEAGVAATQLDNNYADWKKHYLSFESKLSTGNNFYLNLEATQRFDKNDLQITTAYNHKLIDNWNANIEVTYSPQHEVKPQRTFLAGLQHTGIKGFSPGLLLKNARYNNSEVDTSILFFESYLSNYRFGYYYYSSRVTAASLDNNLHHTRSLAIDRFYAAGSSLGIRYSEGDELDYDGVSVPVISPITTTVVTGRHWFAPRWAVRYQLTHHQQGSFYTRKGVELGVRHKF